MVYMKIHYSKHARWRKWRRHITGAMIEKALKEPDKTGIGYNNRNLAYKTFPEGQIKVVYIIENGIPFIISVIWEKGGPPCK